MKTTIDKAGRVVIPAAVRDRAGFTPGTVLEVSVDDAVVHLAQKAAGPTLMKVGRRLVARPSAGGPARQSVDVAALVEDERNRWP